MKSFTSATLCGFCVLLSSVLHISYCRPQLRVVSPDHFLPKNFFAHMVSVGGDGHLVPESFYSGVSKVNPIPDDSESLHEAALTYTAVTVTTPKYRTQQLQQQQQPQFQEQPSQVDSYTNIGSSNTGGDSSVSNAGDYGETVPEQLSKLEPSSYASYPNTN